MTKKKQYAEYLNNGGSMTIEQWEQDGRYDKPIRKPGSGGKRAGSGAKLVYEDPLTETIRVSTKEKALIEKQRAKKLK